MGSRWMVLAVALAACSSDGARIGPPGQQAAGGSGGNQPPATGGAPVGAGSAGAAGAPESPAGGRSGAGGAEPVGGAGGSSAAGYGGATGLSGASGALGTAGAPGGAAGSGASSGAGPMGGAAGSAGAGGATVTSFPVPASLRENASCWLEPGGDPCAPIPQVSPPVVEWLCDSAARLRVQPGTCVVVKGVFVGHALHDDSCVVDPTASCSYEQPESTCRGYTNTGDDDIFVHLHRRRDCAIGWTAWWYPAGECPPC